MLQTTNQSSFSFEKLVQIVNDIALFISLSPITFSILIELYVKFNVFVKHFVEKLPTKFGEDFEEKRRIT